MRTNRSFLEILSICLLLASCASLAQSPQPVSSEPSSIPPAAPLPPTAAFTPEPAPTLIPPTATPLNQVFRDDFTGGLQPGWTWENEKPDRWKITDDGWLQILAEDASVLAGQAQSNMLFRALPEGNFVITAHITTAPDSNFQQTTIFLFEDANNYVAVNRGFCEPCFPGKGNGIFMEYKIGGQFRWSADLNTQVDQTDVYLRLMSKDKIIYGYYALAPDDWHLITRLGDFFEFNRVGLGVTNSDRAGIDSDLVGSYDYFEITRP
ncbi:MAG: hypothetical protein Fur0043_06830 [Anaerolineales bacterium]